MDVMVKARNIAKVEFLIFIVSFTEADDCFKIKLRIPYMTTFL